ncbi:hypothetical protein TPHA_0I00170 [Tetrapisispora phaffii CBS 4417]|uniref:Uncharacterized protein n=1 Tax=Tetrapisispora phaffii (strain ATCC 24235 / CBS 4417 / NBRC 1672 / NRRL Y-8282 / UCD 70-5) TaxID=1071381 RepID=G8BX96_TETPH|nr:hypothetical protein TPHA_0I00170 [Tetrapisispora phaffii CBS 4417]CCE64524.1 hypothetical protein TPHA_0I00170 [Tetrapisispora phaffii CBS 4417]
MTQWFQLQQDHGVDDGALVSQHLRFSLADTCCFNIAKYISSQNLNPHHVHDLIGHVKFNSEYISKIWDLIVLLKGDNLETYLIFKSYLSFKPSGDDGSSYRYESLIIDPNKTQLDIKPTVSYLNSFPSLFNFDGRFITVLDLELDYENLIVLTNINSLVSLAVKIIPRDEITHNIEDIARLWKSSLQLSRGKWKSLTTLSLPQLKNPKIFYDLFETIDSLRALETGINPNTIAQIPLISSKIKYFDDSSLTNKSIYEKYLIIREKCSASIDQYNSVFDIKIQLSPIVQPPLRKYQFISRTTNKHYLTLQQSFIYIRYRNSDSNKRTMEPGQPGLTKNRRMNNIKGKNISVSNFFGYKM